MHQYLPKDTVAVIKKFSFIDSLTITLRNVLQLRGCCTTTNYIMTKFTIIILVIPKLRLHMLVYRTQAWVYAIIREKNPTFIRSSNSEDEQDGICEQKSTKAGQTANIQLTGLVAQLYKTLLVSNYRILICTACSLTDEWAISTFVVCMFWALPLNLAAHGRVTGCRNINI